MRDETKNLIFISSLERNSIEKYLHELTQGLQYVEVPLTV